MPELSAPSAEGASQSGRPWLALSALTIGYFLIMLDQGLMPVITPQLPAEVTGAVWLTSVYLLCTVVPMPVTGRLGDKYGQRRVYLAGLGIYAASLALAAVSWSWTVLVAARALQGFGSAVFLPQAFGTINRIFPSDGRGAAFGAWGVVGSVGSLLGPILGGVVVDALGWRWAFGLQAAIAVLGIAAAWLWLPRLSSTPALIPVAAVALSFGGLGALIYGIQYGSWMAVVAGVAGLAALVLTQRGPDSFLPVVLLRDRNFALGTAAIATMGFAVASMFIPIMYWLQIAAGVDAGTAGLLTAPMSVVAMLLTPYAGAASDRISPRVLCVGGFAGLAVALTAASVIVELNAPPWWFAGVTALLGAGSAFVWAPNATTTMRHVPEAAAGAASGLYNTLRQVGSVIGVALTGAVLAAGDISTTAGPAIALSAAMMVVGAGLSAFLRADIPPRTR